MTEEQFMRSLEAAVRVGSVPPMKLWWEIHRQSLRSGGPRWTSFGLGVMDEFEPADAR